ncbi:MAG: LURP-one-related family protein [Lachnospiraceae bacterium]|nr:LURP-one-related family protein [Lachnospiraceae bacterium]
MAAGIIGILLVFFIVMACVSIARRQRYHASGEGSDIRNTEEYGTPVKSLYTSTKVFTLHHRIEVTDEAGETAYRSESKVISIHDKTNVFRADGTHVAYIWRKFFTLHERHFIEMEDGTKFELSNEILHIIKDVTNIEGLGWQLNGNILQLNFVITDEFGQVVATVGQKMFSIHDKYSVDIYMPQHEEKIIAILITLQHMIRDRANSAAASSGSSSSSGS